MDTGIGRDGYSIIGQGRIDEILSAKSEDRRHIFEEAAGIVKYRSQKKKNLKEIRTNKIKLDKNKRYINREIESNNRTIKKNNLIKLKKYLDLRKFKKYWSGINFIKNKF